MPQANATIVGPHPHGGKMADAENNRFISPVLDDTQYRKPEYFVYVFSIVDPRPAEAPLMRDMPPIVRRLKIAECPPGKPYVLAIRLPHPLNQPDINPSNDQRVTYYHDAKRVAQDIVNPSNTSLDQDAVLKADSVFAEGDDYGKLGLFWSLNEVPTAEELTKARKRKENFYRKLLNDARALEVSNPAALNMALTATHHIAADYFGEEYSWHRTAKRPFLCPNCGDSVKEGVAYHRSADGVVCVIDWQRTVDAGVKTKDQVPESKRWWGEPVKRGPGRPPKVEASE